MGVGNRTLQGELVQDFIEYGVVTAPAISTGLLASPYVWSEVPMEYNSQLLDELVAHPSWFSVPSTPDERRRIWAAALTNPENLLWGVWRADNLLGILILSRVIPSLDALFHFLFLDRNLAGKRDLLHRFLGYCFTSPVPLGFKRLSAEVPEDADKLLRFYRTLGFRFEGEHKATSAYPVASASPSEGGAKVHRPATTIAKFGSRADGMFWREDRWIDVIRVRLLREEWEQQDAATAYRRRSTNSREPDWASPRPETPSNHSAAS